MYKKLVEIVANACHEVFQEMAKISVEGTTIKKDECLPTEFAMATKIAYEDFVKKLNGQFILGFHKPESAVAVASAISEHMGLGVVTQLNEDAENVLSEFMNTIVGHTISKWDTLGLPVRFEPPTPMKDLVITPHDCPQAEAYVITLTLAAGHVTFHVTFIRALHEEMTSKQRVLVVDDSKIIRQILDTTLQEAGYEVALANNGREAVEMYQQVQPALTIMDLVMPEEGGFDAIFDIRQTNPTAKFIVLTSTSRQFDLATAKTLGVSKYLMKPLKAPELLAEVKKALEPDDT